MNAPFEAVKITDRIYWVGAIDWAIRDFHGYATSRGTTYNAFLVLADKVTLIDTVKRPFLDEMFGRIRSVIEPGKIDVIVSNHSEMDHSGCLPEAIRAIGPQRVYASANGVKALREHFGLDGIDGVTTGETISLGNMTLTAIETKMLHWPDSMMTWLAEERVLFSQDGFGMHWASSERFDDELEDSALEWEAAKYYANILMPFAGRVLKALAGLGEMNLPIKMILPDHGPIWRAGFGRIIELYGKWARREHGPKAVVTCDTMWESTGLMARAICDGISAAGAQAVFLPLRACHRSDLASEILDAGALVVGSPTINGQMFPTVADLLCYLEGLKPTDLIGAAFGSYGWSGEATKRITESLERMKVDVVAEPLRAKYVPDENALAACRDLGRRVAEELISRTTA